MKKILVVINKSIKYSDGISSVILNYYKIMEKSDIQIDFASSGDLDNEISSLFIKNESSYFKLPQRNELISYFRCLKRILKGYDVVHINCNSATVVLELLAAWLVSVECRVVHVHNTKNEHPLSHLLLTPLMLLLYTKGIACSKDAGDYLFGKYDYTVLNNAINTEDCRFNEQKRKKYRDLFGIADDEILIGSIGGLRPQKNQIFLLQLLVELRKKKDCYKLMIIGEGGLRTEFEDFIEDNDLKDYVILPGARNDAKAILSAFDLFLFPSLFEGFGLVLLEAQANGLDCIASEYVPSEAKVCSNVVTLSLNEKGRWIETISSYRVHDRIGISRKNIKDIKKTHLDIKTETNKLRDLYLS